MKLTPFAKVFLTLVILGVLGYVGYHYRDTLIPGRAGQASNTPSKVDLPAGPESPASVNANYKVPGSRPGCTDQPEVRMNVWAWNAQMGLMAATGGKQATEGSLMCDEKVNLQLIREDDSNKMQENLTAFATALKNGDKNPKDGIHFVAIMGDGAAQFLKGLNDVLGSKLGHQDEARIVGSCGYSRGEDKFMGPADWRANPSASKGGVCAGVLRDGDWNIALKWLGDNGLRNNPDEHTWDPDALNWVSADTYIDAAKKYVEGYSEDRPVVRNGKPTGEKKHITVDSVVTWTPGDVTVAHGKGGLISIVSTREYSSQMPNVIIGLVPGCRELIAATYTKFGDLEVQQYPKLIPNCPKMDRARDISYVKDIAGVQPQSASAAEAEKPKYDATAASNPKASVVGRRSWAIEFDSGRATFTPQAQQTLDELSRELLVASGTLIQVHGHTDSLGNADKNQSLSEERAFAVKQWLMNKSPGNFPSERISVHAHGASNPVAPNSTAEGRAKNRRVEIVLVSG